MNENEKNTVYLTLNKAFVKESIPAVGKDGEERTFNSVTLPAGTIIDGKDVGLASFTPLFVNPAKFGSSDQRDIPLIADKEVWLNVPVRDGEGNVVTDEAGKWQTTVEKVMPAQIKDALTESRREYNASREKVYISTHKAFVKEAGADNDFSVVRLAPGTVIDGRDLGGAEFFTRFVNEPKQFEGAKVNPDLRIIPVFADKEITLKIPVRGDDGLVMTDDEGKWVTEAVKVDPKALKVAIEHERRAYAASQSKNKDAAVSHETRDPHTVPSTTETLDGLDKAAAKSAAEAAPAKQMDNARDKGIFH